MDSREHAYNDTRDCRKRRRLARKVLLEFQSIFLNVLGERTYINDHWAVVCADATF